MIDLRTYREKKRGWWIEERATVPCALPADGLIVVFRREDVEEFLTRTYPSLERNGERVWYFNETYDREIAEIDAENRVSANPQILWSHYLREKL